MLVIAGDVVERGVSEPVVAIVGWRYTPAMAGGPARKLFSIAAITGLLLSGGCADPLFPEDLPNSPYERYNNLRGRQSAASDRGALRGDPNLRQRLRPLEGP